jgi:hypothetical protein
VDVARTVFAGRPWAVKTRSTHNARELGRQRKKDQAKNVRQKNKDLQDSGLYFSV